MAPTVADTARRLQQLRCLVVIPTYNNAGTIGQVVRAVQHYATDILVVNDGSTDETLKQLEAFPTIRLMGYSRNRGKGYALRQALKVAAETGYRYMLTLDADGQHKPEDIPRFVEYIEQHPDRLLIGARNLTADNMPTRNTFANRFSNFWFRVETGIRLDDTQSGFRLYPVEALRPVHWVCSRYEFEVEAIVRAAWRGIPVVNIPIQVYYAPADERVSHFRPFRDFARISLLNTVLVVGAALYYYPQRLLRRLTPSNLKTQLRRHLANTPENRPRLAAAVGVGVCCGILPIWGYQLLAALFVAHLLRLNKIVAAIGSNISIPPMIPFILYGSVAIGAWIFGIPLTLSLPDLSLATLGSMIKVYLVGSIVLALLGGIFAWAITWAILLLTKRSTPHE